MPDELTPVTIIAEYCDSGIAYTGWHLYVREKTDGNRNTNGDWGWVRDDSRLVRIAELCDLEPPEVPTWCRTSKSGFISAFREKYPDGFSAYRDSSGRLTARKGDQ